MNRPHIRIFLERTSDARPYKKNFIPVGACIARPFFWGDHEDDTGRPYMLDKIFSFLRIGLWKKIF